MRVRIARTLVFTRERDALVGFNYLSRSEFACSAELVARLPQNWTDATELTDNLLEGRRENLDALIESDAVVVQGSPLAKRERDYLAAWEWSLPTGLLHFSLEDPEFIDLDGNDAIQRRRSKFGAQPELYLRNSGEKRFDLPRTGDDPLLGLMARRRTVREPAAPSISLTQLSDCLFAGLGITGRTQNSVVAELPLKMTPSGGARNPYEAYIIARNVAGLPPGTYHYSAIDHDLGLVREGMPPPMSTFLGGQPWADPMPVLIVLVADMRRTMWKYEDSNAYRVVLIEAGHIGQNVMLAATKHGLSACPTAALGQTAIREHLGLDRITDAPLYALTLGAAGGVAAEASVRAPDRPKRTRVRHTQAETRPLRGRSAPRRRKTG